MATSNAISIDLDNALSQPIQESNKIPVIVVEKHKEVASHIREAMHMRKIPMQDLAIIHFDSHPDILGNVNIPAKFAHRLDQYDASYNKNWLLPMTYAGCFDRIVWFRPPWSIYMTDGSTKWIAGKDKKTGFIRLNTKLEFCIYEEMYRNEKDMTDIKKFNFDAITVGNKVFDKRGRRGDNTAHIHRVLSEIKDKPYILDIDVDFFTAHDPYSLMYEEIDICGLVAKIYASSTPIRHNSNATDEAIYEYMEKRSKRLAELEYVMACFKCDAPIPEHIEGYDALMELKQVVDSNNYEIDWDEVHQAGLTIDYQLPDIPDPQHIDTLYQALEHALDNLVDTPPALVTIGSYHNTRYTGGFPEIHAKLIIASLRKKFKNIETQFTYERRFPDENDEN